MKNNYKYILFIFMGMLFAGPTYAQDVRVDSLKNEIQEHETADTIKANALIALCKIYADDVNYRNKVQEYAPQLLLLSQKLNFKKGIANGYLYMGVSCMEKNELSKALTHFFSSLKLFRAIQDKNGTATCLHRIGLTKNFQEKYSEAIQYLVMAGNMREQAGDKQLAASSYNNIGNTYANMANYVDALTFFFKSLKLREAMHDTIGIAISYMNIGNILFEQNKLNESLRHLGKALQLIINKEDTRLKAVIYSNIANTHAAKKEYQEALIYNRKSMKIAEAINDKQGINTCYIYAASAYASQNKFDEAFPYYLKSLELSKELDDKALMIEGYSGIGRYYEQKANYNEALAHYTKAFAIAKEIDYKTGILDAYGNLSSMHEKLGNFSEALAYNKLYSNLKDKLLNEESLKQTAELNTRYETDKKEKEILLLTKDQQLKDKTLKEQALVRMGLIIGLVLFLSLSFLLYNRYRLKRKANLILEKQKQEIHKKNTQITDSIDYAKTIQDAILPGTEKLNAAFNEYFILYKPKAIVSGDFYWIGKKDHKIICAVADCTGHGIPGAFMSLLGHNILENVVQRDTSIHPGAVLTALNEEIVTRFSNGKNQETVKHGMDIAIISVDLTHYQLEYAGARNSLYCIRKHELTEIKADRMSTGIVAKDNKPINYTNNNVILQQGDMLYLFSDGFPDQKGGPEKRKFYYQPFKELLISISGLPVHEQKQRLDKTIADWMGSGEQIDDILIMGIRC